MHRNLGLCYLHSPDFPPFPRGWTPPHSPHSGEPSHYSCEPLLPQCDSNAAGILPGVLHPSDMRPRGGRDNLLDADAWVSGMLLRKLACIQGGAPMDSCSPCHVPSPAGSTGSIGSGASPPLGGHILCTCSETPLQMREQSSSSSLCSHHSKYNADSHESEGSGGPPGGQPDIEWDDEANKGSLITLVVRNLMVMLRSEMKVASKTMLKRWTSPAVMRLVVKPRAARCLW